MSSLPWDLIYIQKPILNLPKAEDWKILRVMIKPKEQKEKQLCKRSQCDNKATYQRNQIAEQNLKLDTGTRR